LQLERRTTVQRKYLISSGRSVLEKIQADSLAKLSPLPEGEG
jgi:hypothetical protein